MDEITNDQASSSAAAGIHETDPIEKIKSRMVALFALQGWQLFELADGSYLAIIGGATHALPGLSAARAFLSTICG